MRIYILLSLVFVGKTLALSRYKREARDILFSDDASVSAGLGGIGGKFEKNIDLKELHGLLSIFGLSDESDNNKIDLNIKGGIGFKPKLSLGGDDGGFGISLGGTSGLGIGMSGNNKKLLEKGHANKHDKSKEHRGSSEESNISRIWKLTRSLDVGVESGHTDHKTSLGTGGISTNLDDGISFNITGRKHDHRYNEHESHKKHHNNDNGLTEYKGSAKTNWATNRHLGKDKNSYWNEGEIIVVPISDEEKSKGVVDKKSHSTKGKTLDNREKDYVNIDGIIIIPFGDSGESGEISSSDSKNYSGSEDHNNHDEKKEGNGNKHVEREESITISHDNGGQSNGGDKEHNNGNGNDSSHVKGGGTATSHAGHKDGHNKSKEHKKSWKRDKTKKSAEKREHGSNHIGGGESITISHSKDGQLSNGNYDSHVKEEDNTVRSHDSHKKIKEQESSKQTETKKNGKKEEDSSNHKGGQSNGHIGNGNNDAKEENTNTHSNGKGIIVIINGSYGNENQSKNSTGRGSMIADKESDSHKKNNEILCNYGEILSTGKCGSNIKLVLQLVQTFIHSFDDIIHFLLELKVGDLRRVLCQVSPHNSKLFCQLGCDDLHNRLFFKHF